MIQLLKVKKTKDNKKENYKKYEKVIDDNKMALSFKVNGKGHSIVIDPKKTLLDVLREDLNLTGTKKGCGSGECGACTVVIDGNNVNSCMIFAMDMEGKEVTTIEGLAPKTGEIHPIQQAFVDHGAIQCGFCSPGMIMSTTAVLEKYDNPTEEQIREGISGNLCRCTGYVKIVDAIQHLAEQRRGGEE